MAHKKHRDLLYPTIANVERFHDLIITQRGTSGHNSNGLVDVGLEWAQYLVDNYYPSPGLLQRAGAMMFAYVLFHAWNDGNKRTALLTTDYFFFLNDYTLVLTEDAPFWTRDFYLRCIDPSSSTIDRIEEACSWFRKRLIPIASGMGRGLTAFLVRNNMLDPIGREIILDAWLAGTAKRFAEFERKDRPTAVNSV
jgi:prophage maintenance system killer protein